eukprot:Skav229636  [mRNA]  locus=scaffold649:254213:254572:- [translate_table: standard]
MLNQNRLPVGKLTSDGNVQQRTLIVENFANPFKKDPVILVTNSVVTKIRGSDVLGRGLDFTTCMYVVMWSHICRISAPRSNGVREYVHRIGRIHPRMLRQNPCAKILEISDIAKTPPRC